MASFLSVIPVSGSNRGTSSSKKVTSPLFPFPPGVPAPVPDPAPMPLGIINEGLMDPEDLSLVV
eukprot:CAMPEP_0204627520 /NCGR_PEP_ID=MMETSP0717-20131115/13878_1 /ASSEMBLY_ACC=CAM_ASM_000666 /TAXON_ID=230516 /ORGANISM="Chaetoceros curvisetus" /LENGTH=63 /DNA_ID=CAMNT_0051643799 /DNA_START=1798 /DNA_END=1985 /DNA_ORIENTATION=-